VEVVRALGVADGVDCYFGHFEPCGADLFFEVCVTAGLEGLFKDF